jgi:hypothetical protein
VKLGAFTGGSLTLGWLVAMQALAGLPAPIHGVTGAAVVGGLIYTPGGGTIQGGIGGSTLFQVYRPVFECPSG